MNKHIILGRTIDTDFLILKLKRNGIKDLYVIDYDKSDFVENLNDVTYFSPEIAQLHFLKTNNVYYKALYILPTIK